MLQNFITTSTRILKAKNTLVLKSAIYMLLLHLVDGNVFFCFSEKNTIKFEREERTMIMMRKRNKNVNNHLAFVLYSRMIKTAEIY